MNRSHLAALGFAFTGLAAVSFAQQPALDEPTGRSWKDVGFAEDPRLDRPQKVDKSEIATTPQVTPGKLTGDVVVKFAPKTDVRAFAAFHGLQIARRFVSDPNIFVLKAGTPAAAQVVAYGLRSTPGVQAVFEDRLLPVKPFAFVPNDPYFPYNSPAGYDGQWHLKNGMGGSTDARLTGAWNLDRTGLNVIVGVIDDGVQIAHPDLSPNYVSADSWDFFFGDGDPSPVYPEEAHGTAVAGVAAARGGNGVGGTGAAPHAGLAGLKIVYGSSTESQFADAVLYHSNSAGGTIRVKNHSYGISAPFIASPLEVAAGTTSASFGTIHVYAAGNERDDANKKAMQSNPNVITVAALAEDGRFSLYSNFGANILCTAPSSGDWEGRFAMVTTTDRTGADGYTPWDPFPNSDYTSTFGGTSSASPLVAGIMALVKQVTPTADVRLAKHMVARTSIKVHQRDRTYLSDGGWRTNAAGFKFNQNYGFGLINAANLTNTVKKFAGCSPLQTTDTGVVSVNADIPDAGAAPVIKTMTVNSTTPLEEVQLYLNLTHPWRGDIIAFLTSPQGTSSRLCMYNGGDNGDNIDWWFTSNAFWGENPQGTWTLTIYDVFQADTGKLVSCRLVTRGGIPLPPYNSAFVSQTGVPNSVAAGSTFNATITLRNNGYFAWDNIVYLVSQNPSNNGTWGVVQTQNASTVNYQGNATFTRTYTAPTTPGVYNFQWRLRKTGLGFFGATTPNVAITVN